MLTSDSELVLPSPKRLREGFEHDMGPDLVPALALAISRQPTLQGLAKQLGRDRGDEVRAAPEFVGMDRWRMRELQMEEASRRRFYQLHPSAPAEEV